MKMSLERDNIRFSTKFQPLTLNDRLQVIVISVIRISVFQVRISKLHQSILHSYKVLSHAIYSSSDPITPGLC
jgi:hypothetical protein